jgi:hypothetical protein
MSRPRRPLTVLACAAVACALNAPTALAAPHGPASGKGVVLSLARHGVRLVDRGHRVEAIRLASSRGVRPGDVVTVRDGRARVSDHVRKLSFLARVARSSSRGVVLTLGDGSSFTLRTGPRRRQQGARSAAGAPAGLPALAAGQALLVTLAVDGPDAVVLSVKRLDRAGGERAGDRRGGDERGAPDPGDEGDCGEDEYVDEDGWCVGDEEDGDEVDGTVAAIAPDASSLTLAPDDGGDALAIPVGDAGLLDGIEVGDDVAVTLDEDGTAIDVELLDWVEDPGDEDPGDDDA